MGVLKDIKDHLKHRLSPATILKESLDTITQKIIPQGADEIGNALYGGSAYLPWPGKGEDLTVPKPEPQPEVQAAQSETIQSGEPSQSYDGYVSGYRQVLQEAADRAQFLQPEDQSPSR